MADGAPAWSTIAPASSCTPRPTCSASRLRRPTSVGAHLLTGLEGTAAGRPSIRGRGLNTTLLEEPPELVEEDPRIAERRRTVATEQRRRRRRWFLTGARRVHRAGRCLARHPHRPVRRRRDPGPGRRAHDRRTGRRGIGAASRRPAARHRAVERRVPGRHAAVGRRRRSSSGGWAAWSPSRSPSARRWRRSPIRWAVVHLVDASGRLLGPSRATPTRAAVPRGGDPRRARASIGARRRRCPQVLAALPPGVRSRVTAIVVADDGSLSLRLRPEGMVVLGPPTDLAAKLAKLTTIMGQVDQRNIAGDRRVQPRLTRAVEEPVMAPGLEYPRRTALTIDLTSTSITISPIGLDRCRPVPVDDRTIPSTAKERSMAPNPQNYLAVIKVVGVGGGGVNAVNRMIDAGLKGVEFIAVNTDAQALLMSDADVKLDIGRELTRGLGAGSDPEVGKAAAEAHPTRSKRCSRAPTWCSSPPARAAAPAPAPRRSSPRSPRASGALTIGVVTRPFGFEGQRRAVQAESGIQTLKEKVDTLIVIPNDRLLTVSNDKTSVLNAFKMADEVLLQGVQGITDLITTPGPHQHRLRRREDGHERRRLGPHGHRLRLRRRAGARARPAPPSPARCSRPPSRAPAASCSPSPVAPTSACSRSTRPPRSSTGWPIPTPTSSSARSSTTRWATRSASRSSPPASTAGTTRRRASGRRGDGDHEPRRATSSPSSDDDDLERRRRLRRPVVPQVAGEPASPSAVAAWHVPLPAGGSVHVRATDRADGDLAHRPRPDGRWRRRAPAVVDRPWVWLRQVHGAGVIVVEPSRRPGRVGGRAADAVVTVAPTWRWPCTAPTAASWPCGRPRG